MAGARTNAYCSNLPVSGLVALRSMPGQQTVVVAFTWDGQQQAQLYYVIDNGKSKIVATDNLKGKGKVSATFTMPASATHDLQWSLWFPGKTLKNLALTTSVDGDERDIDSADSQDHRWAGEGTWR